MKKEKNKRLQNSVIFAGPAVRTAKHQLYKIMHAKYQL